MAKSIGPSGSRILHHYERMGDFAKAEDALFAIVDMEKAGPELLEFGTTFYRRLLSQSDTFLIVGNLPRHEVEAGLAEFRAKMKA